MPWPQVAARYVARESAVVFLGVFAVLLIVGLSARFIAFLQAAADGRFTAEALLVLLALRIPEFVQVTAPFALFLALLLTAGRLHAEREYAVLATAGASPGRFVRWLSAIVLPVAALVAALSLVVTPEARKRYADLSLAQLVDSEFDALVPGAFHTHDEGRRVSYAAAVNPATNQLEGVFFAERVGPKEVTVWAKSGRQHRHPTTQSRFLELRDGVRYEGRPGEGGYRVVAFDRLGQRLAREAPIPLIDVRSFRTRDLDGNDPVEAAELHGRIAWPLMTVIAALAAFGMARPPPRAGRFGRAVPGVALFVAYYLALVFAQDGIAAGLYPPAVGLWFVHAVMLAAALSFIRAGTRPAGGLLRGLRR